jgi:signal transduction histidine kinase
MLQSIINIFRTTSVLIVMLILICVDTYAQPLKRANTFSYNINEGLLQSHVSDMTFDKYGFGWLSFANGLQKFNGKTFEIINIQAGLADDKAVVFAKASNKEIFFSTAFGISWYNANRNSFIQIYALPKKQLASPIFLGEIDNTLYFVTIENNIICINLNTHKIICTIPFKKYENESKDFNCNSTTVGSKLMFNYGLALYILNTINKKVEPSILGTKSMQWSNLQNSNNPNKINYLVGSKKGIYLNALDLNKGKEKDSVMILPSKNSLCRLFLYKSSYINLVAAYNDVYETDASFTTIKSKWINFQNQPCAGNALIDKIVEDNYGNIYLLTVNEGFKKIITKNYPLKYYGAEKTNNNIISLHADKENNNILAGSYGNGLFIYDTAQQLKKHITTLPNGDVNFSISSIIKIKKDSYLLFQFNTKNAWLYNSQNNTFQLIKCNNHSKDFGFFGNAFLKNEHTAICFNEAFLYEIDFSSTIKIKEFLLATGADPASMLYKNHLVTGNKEVIAFYNSNTFILEKTISLNNTGGIKCFAKDKDNNMFIGCNKGLIKIDSTGKQLWKVEKKDGLPDDCIYAIAIDESENIWCSTNKGIFKLDNNKKIVVIRKEDGLQENEFNTNMVFKTNSGELFFAGVNGVSSFYPSQINAAQEKLQILTTAIKINGEDFYKDTAVWNLQNISLPYDKNNISINFTAIGGGNPDQYVYQYKMEGVDAAWTIDNQNGFARYNLQPGKYVFKMYASKSFNKDAIALKEIVITITEPFWKTAWFFILLSLFVLGTIAYNINLYNRRKYTKQLNEIKEQQKIQAERERISKELHDNIGVQANAILYNTSMLNHRAIDNEKTINNLQETAKEMLLNLRETLWAMKTTDVQAMDLWLRIINFTKQMSRHYTNINFTIEGEVPKNVIITSTKALNIVLVLQETVNNAVKHAAANTITTTSSFAHNTWTIEIRDNGQGFNLEEAKHKTDSYGLQNMRERAIENNFSYRLSSSINGGTHTCMIINHV